MLRSLIDLKPRDVALRVALRNTLAMTTGAINTMFTDLPGAYRLRMRRMFIAALGPVAALILAGGLLQMLRRSPGDGIAADPAAAG